MLKEGQKRSVRNIVRKFKDEYPDAKVKVDKNGNCFLNEDKVLNFKSILSENDSSSKYFLDKLKSFYDTKYGSDLNLSKNNTYKVILDHVMRNLKYVGKNNEGKYIFEEVSTPILESKHEKYYFSENKVKKIFNHYDI